MVSPVRNPLGLVEEVEQLFRSVPQGFQEDGGGELAPPVDPHIKDVLGIELEIDPGPPERNQPRRVDDFTAGVDLGLVMVDEQTGRAVQLAHHHPLSAINNESAVFGHQRQGAEINLLFFDVPDGQAWTSPCRTPGTRIYGHFRSCPLLALVIRTWGRPSARRTPGSTRRKNPG
jgi:hypothetical protein